MDKKADSIPSNEEILSELTKDLEKTCIKDPNIKEGSSKEGGDSANFDVLPDEQESEKAPESEAPQQAEDFIDEERLKDREINLTDEEKENLKCEAETLKNEGNTLFMASKYHTAMITYTQALQTCPLAYEKDRAILYANRAAAKAKFEDKKSAIDDCTKALELNPSYMKALVRRAQLNEQTEHLDEALEDYKKILEHDPGNSEANHATRRLPPLIQEKNEKLKEEMLGKLKDLGNMILKPFGLSTNNFQMEKDPSSGGYSVKFNQNSS